MGPYRINKPGHYFVQIFIFFIADEQGRAETERVDLALLLDVDVLVNVLGNFPRDR